MDKVKLVLESPHTRIIVYENNAIEIIPFLTVSQQVFLIKKYVEDLFNKEIKEGSTGYNYLDAEYNLMNYLYQLVTNIDTESLDNDVYADYKLWEEITSQIVNYQDFRKKLDIVISEEKFNLTLENSVGKILSDLVAKAYVILDKISEISPEEIEKLQKTGMDIAKTLEKSSVLTATPKPKRIYRKKSGNVGKA